MGSEKTEILKFHCMFFLSSANKKSKRKNLLLMSLKVKISYFQFDLKVVERLIRLTH